MISVSPINIYWRDVRCPLVIDWHPGWAQAQRSQRESGAGTRAFRVALRQLSNQIKSPAIGMQSADERFLFLFFFCSCPNPSIPWVFQSPYKTLSAAKSNSHVWHRLKGLHCLWYKNRLKCCGWKGQAFPEQKNVILFCWFSKWTFKWSWDVPEHVNVFVYEMLYAIPPTLC